MRPCDIVLILGVVSNFLTFGSKVMGKDEAKHEDGRLIITPGGPKSPDKVHTIEPGKHLEIKPDGSYSIVPDRNTDDKSTAPPDRTTKEKK